MNETIKLTVLFSCWKRSTAALYPFTVIALSSVLYLISLFLNTSLLFSSFIFVYLGSWISPTTLFASNTPSSLTKYFRSLTVMYLSKSAWRSSGFVSSSPLPLTVNVNFFVTVLNSSAFWIFSLSMLSFTPVLAVSVTTVSFLGCLTTAFLGVLRPANWLPSWMLSTSGFDDSHCVRVHAVITLFPSIWGSVRSDTMLFSEVFPFLIVSKLIPSATVFIFWFTCGTSQPTMTVLLTVWDLPL